MTMSDPGTLPMVISLTKSKQPTLGTEVVRYWGRLEKKITLSFLGFGGMKRWVLDNSHC